jgi:hypothetical protein
MSWEQVAVIGVVNFFSVFMAMFIISAINAFREARRKNEFLERMLGGLIEKAETDTQFRNIMGWNFMGNERDNNDER